MTAEIRVGDQTRHEITVLDEDGMPIDLSVATALEFVFRKPSGATFRRTPVIVTDGTDGKVSYTMQAGELDIPGHWKLQVVTTLPIGSRRSTIVTFEVHGNLD